MTVSRPILFSGPMVRAIFEGKTQTRRRMNPQPAAVEYHLHGKPSNAKEGLPTMREASGKGWGMCGPFRCPYIGDGVVVTAQGKLVNARTDDLSDRRSELWVKETFRYVTEALQYQADGAFRDIPEGIYSDTEPTFGRLIRWQAQHEKTWRSCLLMPRWASRLTLHLTHVRVERLQDISEEDAKAEGAPKMAWGDCSSIPMTRQGGKRFIKNPAHSCHLAGFYELWQSIHGEGSWDENPWVWVLQFPSFTLNTL